MIALRSALFNVAWLAWTVCFTVILAPMHVLPLPTFRAALRVWSGGIIWLLARLVGITMCVRGTGNIPEGPAIIASKHQSVWETITFNQFVAAPAFVIKQELLRIPLFGWHMLRGGTFAVDRGGGARALKQMVKSGREVLARGQQIVIFPEGTRTAPGSRSPYLPGIAALYTRLGVPVVPAALNSGLFWSRRGFLKRPGRITVEFLPPIAPGLDRRRFLAELEERIETASRRLERDAFVDKSVDDGRTAGHTPVKAENAAEK
ncbi:MAG: lysophospholipid acyltransferase family protein [Alphaproteobacteria bacterium]